MPFRYNDAEDRGCENAKSLFVNQLPIASRTGAEKALWKLIGEFGPVVETYPCWHPLVSSAPGQTGVSIIPSQKCGYEGLENTLYLRDAFVSCPTDGGEKILNSVSELQSTDNGWSQVKAKSAKFPFYDSDSTPIIVWCEWERGHESDGTILRQAAVGRFLEQQLATWTEAEAGESWKTRRNHFLGQPCGARSSLFINQDTGQKMKTAWNAILASGVFGEVFE